MSATDREFFYWTCIHNFRRFMRRDLLAYLDNFCGSL